MPSYNSVDEVIEEVNRYDETVRLFTILERVMTDIGLSPQIEPTCVKPSGEKCTPDFVIEETRHKTIIEHKASLSERPENAKGTLEGILDNYSPLIEDSDTGQVGALFSKKDEESVQLIMHFLEESLVLSTFHLSLHPRILQIVTLKGMYLSESVKEIMSSIFDYDFLEFSRYQLLRQKPPIPLAADIIWSYILLPLYGRSGGFGEEETIDYQDVLEETQTQVRGYGQDSEDSLRGVVNRTLKFLTTLGWVEFKEQDRPLKVYPKKAKGKGQIRQFFCQKLFDLKTKGVIEDDDNDEEDEDTEQSSLDEYKF